MRKLCASSSATFVVVLIVVTHLLPQAAHAQGGGPCAPVCKQGRWYTLGIPVVNCPHEDETAWLTRKVCKPDVSLSQLLPLVKNPDKCQLRDLKVWLDTNCDFPLMAAQSAAAKNLSKRCKPKCKKVRWWSAGVPQPDCDKGEYERWMNEFMCDANNPVSVADLVETANKPDKCTLDELNAWLDHICGVEAAAVAAAGATTPPGESAYVAPGTYERAGASDANVVRKATAPEQRNGRVRSAPSQAQAAPQGKASPPARCLLPKDPGPCRGLMEAYHYDARSGMCTRFAYGGCQGNANRFDSHAACVAACEAPMTLSLLSCGAGQGPAVLNMSSATPGAQLAIFRAGRAAREQPDARVRVPDTLKCAGTPLGLSGSFQSNGMPGGRVQAWSVDAQPRGETIFKIPEQSPGTCTRYVYQALDMATCQLSNILDTRDTANPFAAG